MKTDPTTYVAKDKRAYSLSGDEDGYGVVFDPTYEGQRIYGTIRPRASDQDEFNEGLLDDDLHGLDGVSMAALDSSQHPPDCSITQRLEEEPFSTDSWYDDLPLDDDLPAPRMSGTWYDDLPLDDDLRDLYALSTTTVLR